MKTPGFKPFTGVINLSSLKQNLTENSTVIVFNEMFNFQINFKSATFNFF